MAFFCPNSFKKEKPSRGTDAYSAKEEMDKNNSPVTKLSYFEVVEDYYACSALELPVKAGEIVQHMSTEGQWVFVCTGNGSDGYIPRRHCRVVENTDSSLRHSSEVSDVGYYSDHFEESHVTPHDNRMTRNRQKYNASRDPTYCSSRHDISSSSASPSSTISNYYTSSPSTCLNHDWSDNTCLNHDWSDNTYLNHDWSDNTYLNHDWSDIKGLYKPRTYSKNYIPEISPKIKLQTYSQPTNEAVAICGRSCKQGCVHRSKRYSRQEFLVGDKRYGTHKSSVVSIISSGKYDKENENRMKKRNPEYQNTTQETNHRKVSTDMKKLIISDTQKHLHQHKELQNNMKSMHKHVKAKSHQSAPVDLIKTKCGHPELIVIKDYTKQGETDLTIERGDFAAIINDTKYEEWVYIMNESGIKGFVPAECIIKHNCEDCQTMDELNEKSGSTNPYQYKGDPTKYDIPDVSKMTKLAVIENYSGRHLDDLYVCIGDFVYIGTKHQSIDGWYWVYSPRLKCSGYLPRDVVKDTTEVDHATV